MSPVNRGGQMIFTDDLIVNANGDIGMVERAPNSSDEDSDIDDDIIDDEQDSGLEGKLPPGSARVRWRADDQLKTELTANLQLSDRVFLMGDIVARASNQLGQTGIVVGMRMYCDVRSGSDDLVLRRVPTRTLQPLAACRPGALVVHPQAHWLGRVDEVYDNVQIQFPDGASCKVMRTSANSLAVHSGTMDEQTWFWPGMQASSSRPTRPTRPSPPLGPFAPPHPPSPPPLALLPPIPPLSPAGLRHPRRAAARQVDQRHAPLLLRRAARHRGQGAGGAGARALARGHARA
jgi:hypothetical protein